MRTLIVEIDHPDHKLLRVEVPDNATVTLQGLNPTNAHTNGGNPPVLRVYGPNKKQLAAIPHVVMWREEGVITIHQLVNKPNVVGMTWEELKDPLFDMTKANKNIAVDKFSEDFGVQGMPIPASIRKKRMP